MAVVTRSRSRSASAEPAVVVPTAATRVHPRHGRQKKLEPKPVTNLAEEVIPEEEELRSEVDGHSDDFVIIKPEIQPRDNESVKNGSMSSIVIKPVPQQNVGVPESLSGFLAGPAFPTISGDQPQENDHVDMSEVMVQQLLIPENIGGSHQLSDMVHETLATDDDQKEHISSDIPQKQVFAQENRPVAPHWSNVVTDFLEEFDLRKENMFAPKPIEGQVQDGHNCPEGLGVLRPTQQEDLNEASIQDGREVALLHNIVGNQTGTELGRSSHQVTDMVIYEGVPKNRLDSDDSLQIVPTVPEGPTSPMSIINAEIYKCVAKYIKDPLLTHDVAEMASLMYHYFDECKQVVWGGSRLDVSLKLLSYDVIAKSSVIQRNSPSNIVEILESGSNESGLTLELARQVENCVNILLSAQVVANYQHAKAAGLPKYSSGLLFKKKAASANVDALSDVEEDEELETRKLTHKNKEIHTKMTGHWPKLGEEGAALLNMEPAMIQKAARLHKGYFEPSIGQKIGLLGRVHDYVAEQPSVEFIGTVRLSHLIERLETGRCPLVDASNQNEETSDNRPLSGVVRRSPPRAAGSHPYQRKSLSIEVNNSIQLPQQGTPDTEFWRLHGASAAATPAATPTGCPKEILDVLQQQCGDHVGVDLSSMYTSGSIANRILLQSRRHISKIAIKRGSAAVIAEQQRCLVMVADFWQHMWRFQLEGFAGISPSDGTFMVDIPSVEPGMMPHAGPSRERAEEAADFSFPKDVQRIDQTPPPHTPIPFDPFLALPEFDLVPSPHEDLGIEVYNPAPPDNTSTTVEEYTRFFNSFKSIVSRRYGGEAEDSEMQPSVEEQNR